jgi:hypothetical protein
MWMIDTNKQTNNVITSFASCLSAILERKIARIPSQDSKILYLLCCSFALIARCAAHMRLPLSQVGIVDMVENIYVLEVSKEREG